jgi:phospholipid/cholesterol/gamma-HCH transport system substrate-binding protein
MKRSIVETILGAVVIVVALGFLAFSYQKADGGTGAGGFEVSANFSGIGGLKPGDDVQISGVKVGTVQGVDLDKDSYLARVHLNLDPSIKLPADTAALISSESLLGGKYLELQPGSDEELIAQGGTIQYTQAPQNLEQLLGQFIFSMQGEKKEDEGKAQGAPEAEAAHSPSSAPSAGAAPAAMPSEETP